MKLFTVRGFQKSGVRNPLLFCSSFESWAKTTASKSSNESQLCVNDFSAAVRGLSAACIKRTRDNLLPKVFQKTF